MGVQLREKEISGGRVSYYLDIYHNQNRWTEFLKIHVNKKKPSTEDKEKKRLANEIRIRRENELIVQENDLVDKGKSKAEFSTWFENYMVERNLRYTHNKSTLKHLNNYLDGKPLPFKAITPEWIRGFTNYLLSLVSNNSAFDYTRNMFTALEDAVRLGIISQNPYRKIPKHERMKRKPIFRNAFTLPEIQLLADTPCEMPGQVRHAFLLSCFCGLRWSDINCLRWSEIIIKMTNNVEEWFVYFEQEKTEDIEYLPLSEGAVQILKARKCEQENEEPSVFVFPSILEVDLIHCKTGKKMNYYLKKWAKAAGLDPKRMHFHVARHSFATNVLESSPEADLWTVSKLLGHKTIVPTQIYAHVRDSRKKAAVHALPALRLKPTSNSEAA